MSAAVLREAAALMRSRAGAAVEGPWRSFIEGRDHLGGDDVIVTKAETDLYVRVIPGVDADVADGTQDHIASWHPVVALAVADWLEAVADRDPRGLSVEAEPALAVARAYVGGGSGE